MSSVKYEFRYMPLIGKLSGESMLQQTEQAINEIAEIVNENTAQADIINTLAQDANDNSVEALEKANEALETSSRVYIHEDLAVNLDSYCESQLIYVANISSTNLPIAKKGFLEVKTDDDKTECVQLFVSDDKDVYVRSGSITAETVGDVTVYTADFEEWASLSSPTILLQAGNGTSIPLSADLNDYNTEGTFYCSTTNVDSIAHCPVSEGEFKLIVMKFATANYGLQMLYPSGQHLYVRKYSGGAWGNWEVIVPKITSGVTNGSIAVNDTDVAVTGWNTKADLDSPVFVGTPTAPTPASSDDSTKIATTKFVHDNTDNKLPLAGGTMTGTITSSVNTTLKRNVDNANNIICGGTSTSNGGYAVLYGKDHSSSAGKFLLSTSDNKYLIGSPDGTLAWNGQPIQTSSDKRLKQDFSNVPDDVLEAWGKVNWQQFKYIDDAERKGVNNCRWHTGLVAQDVKEIGEENNVDLLRYGILCHDVRRATAEQEAVDLWTVRYEEALAMEAAYQRRRADRLEERIEALEKMLMNRTE